MNLTIQRDQIATMKKMFYAEYATKTNLGVTLAYCLFAFFATTNLTFNALQVAKNTFV